jgi:hypothetical protein
VAGIFRRLFKKLVELYDDVCGIEWEWAPPVAARTLPRNVFGRCVVGQT